MAEIKVVYDDHMGDCLKVARMAKDSFGRTTDWEWRCDRYDQDNDISLWESEGWEFAQESTSGDIYRRLSQRDHNLLYMLSRGMGQDEYSNYVKELQETSDPDRVKELLWGFRNTASHLAPFGHNFLTVKFQAPVFVMRQIVKHKFLRLSELSMRYVRGMPEYYEPKSWRAKAELVKQGSGEDHWYQEEWYQNLVSAWYDDEAFYTGALEDDLCPEQARMFLRLCHMTQGHISGSMDAWANLVKQRLDPHAQEETRQFARQVDKIATELWPYSWEALMEGVER